MPAQGPAPLSTGSWVQYNAGNQSPLAPSPTPAEQTIGIVRQLYSAQGKQFAQVVWNPGSRFPQTALYTADLLTPITQQQAVDITNQMNAGTYQPNEPSPGSTYQQPPIPQQALPPGLQGTTDVTPTLTGAVTAPLSPGGYQ